MKDKGIAFVLPTGMALGGVTTWSVETCRRLNAVGVRAALLCHAAPEGELALTEPDDMPVFPVGGVPASVAGPEDLPEYLPAYRRFMPCVFVPNYSWGSYAACALLALGEADTVRVTGLVHADSEPYYEKMRHYEPMIHLFVAVSDEIAAKLARMLPERADDIVTRAYPVKAPDVLERDYPPEGEPLRLVYAGRLEREQKRVLDLVKLAGELERRGVDFRLRIIGEGDAGDELSAQIASLGPAARARLSLQAPVPPEKMAAVWRQSDVCVLVSAFEGTSISMLEGMAQGCVPVVTGVSGTAAVIRQGENGFTAPVGRVDQMAELIRRLDFDRGKLAEIGANAHATVRERFACDRYMDWFCEMAEGLWRQSPRPWPPGRPVFPPRQRTAASRVIAKLRRVFGRRS